MELIPKRNGVYEKNNCLTTRKYIITKKNCKKKGNVHNGLRRENIE